MTSDKEPAAVWAKYRRRRTLSWGIPLAIFATAFILDFTGLYGGAWWLFVIPAFLLLALKMLWFERWPCPRCGKPFTYPKRYFTYAEACQYCRLGLWKDPGDVEAYHEKMRMAESRIAAVTAKLQSSKQIPKWSKPARRKSRGKPRQQR